MTRELQRTRFHEIWQDLVEGHRCHMIKAQGDSKYQYTWKQDRMFCYYCKMNLHVNKSFHINFMKCIWWCFEFIILWRKLLNIHTFCMYEVLKSIQSCYTFTIIPIFSSSKITKFSFVPRTDPMWSTVPRESSPNQSRSRAVLLHVLFYVLGGYVHHLGPLGDILLPYKESVMQRLWYQNKDIKLIWIQAINHCMTF